MTPDDTNTHPADIAPVAESLDQLGAADRAAATAGFEGRVARAAVGAVAPSLRLASADGLPRATPPRSSTGSRWLAGSSMRMAASVAIVAGGVAGWLAMQPAPTAGPPPISLEQDVDAWLAFADPDDSLSIQIEAMLLQSADLARGLNSGWMEDELMGEPL